MTRSLTKSVANPAYAARLRRRASQGDTSPAEKVVIGDATLYRANCCDALPNLSGVDAVITDPPYCIGFEYRSYDDAPARYHALMTRLIPELIRVTDDGPCFVWQSPLKADSVGRRRSSVGTESGDRRRWQRDCHRRKFAYVVTRYSETKLRQRCLDLV